MHEDEYTMVEDVVAPEGAWGPSAHLVDYETQALVSQLWSKYLAEIRDQIPPSEVRQAMRRVTYSLDGEAFAGQQLQRGIRVASRTRRGCTFEGALWQKDDGRFVHRSEMVTVFVEPGTGAVEIPEDFWNAVEKVECREIPVTERTS